MTDDQATEAVEMLEDLGWEAEVYEEYSGKGMYGDTCTGIMTDAPPVLIGWALGAVGVDAEDLPQRQDSMGRRSLIVY